jgi:hypothetical protein
MGVSKRLRKVPEWTQDQGLLAAITACVSRSSAPECGLVGLV